MGIANPATADSSRVLVGRTPAILQVWDQIDRIGTNTWPVLVLGETGTGKELAARTIHNRANLNRTPGPFVVIDCSSLVGPLMESELFGHVKGAFTGATGTKLGLIEVANGGTAFFDEIGELPLDMQAKLLRVFQEKEFRPVGSVHTRKSDFRMIAATHRDLAAEVARGKFRQDLYYRMKVITLRLPAVRDRAADIPELLGHFLSRHGNDHEFEHQLMDAMLTYEWPGNVRELDNCVQHAVAHCRGNIIGLQDLPTTIANHVIAGRSDMMTMSAAVARVTPQEGRPETRMADQDPDPVPREIITLYELERRHILRVLDYTRGDRASSAMHLGIGRTTLYRKLKEYGISTGIELSAKM